MQVVMNPQYQQYPGQWGSTGPMPMMMPMTPMMPQSLGGSANRNPVQGGSSGYVPTNYGSVSAVNENNYGVSQTLVKKESVSKLIEQFEIDYTELHFEKEIGRGSYGVVFKGQWRGGTVAIKQLAFKDTMSAKDLADFRAEAKLMASLRPHVNVVQFLGITGGQYPLCIVTEFLDQGSLYGFLHGGDVKIDTNMMMTLVKGVAAGMLHLHREGLIHRDLAARNILIGSGFQVKITDFGLARPNAEGNNKTKSETGPLKWMSPEAIKNRTYSKASDVWAFGVVLYEVLSRQDPYADLDPVQAALEVTHSNLRLPIPPYAPVIVSEIMAGCFQTGADKRPSFAAIYERLRDARMEDWTSTIGENTPKALIAPDALDDRDEGLYAKTPVTFQQFASQPPTSTSTDNSSATPVTINSQPVSIGGPEVKPTGYETYVPMSDAVLNGARPASTILTRSTSDSVPAPASETKPPES